MKRLLSVFLLSLLPVLTALAETEPANQPNRVVAVDMAVIQTAVSYNRLGAHLPNAQLYVLTRDLVSTKGGTELSPGQVALRPGKRPRPIVLRANEGDELRIHFHNLLPLPTKQDEAKLDCSPKNTSLSCAGVQIMGLQWLDDNNAVRLAPGQSHEYRFFANAEGVFMLYSPNDQSFRESQLDYGLFGSVNIQPREAEYYRSQVTWDDLRLANYRVNRQFMTTYWDDDSAKSCETFMPGENFGLPNGVSLRRKPIRKGSHLICPKGGLDTRWEFRQPTRVDQKTAKIADISINAKGYLRTQKQQPVINYQAVYPKNHEFAGLPILNMLAANPDEGRNFALAHTDLTAIITGPDAGRFPYYLDSPSFRENPATPDRRQPYREFSIMYHIAPNTQQPFEAMSSGPLQGMLAAGEDGFAINYGIGGIAAEILANRLGKGPMGINRDEVDLKFEEFFLSSWAVGDPGMVVDVPANSPTGRATKALYPDDPSNVYHAYMRDHVKFRVINAGSVAPHVHHQHAHQWLHSPDSDDGHYLDSQLINPGSTYTLEMTYNGSGNRNQTVGDSIFHCHIYPHFAQGMWSLWRVHDVFEEGTRLDANGYPYPNARALPDGEIVLGTPIPAVVPMPSLGMAPMPAEVRLTDQGRRVEVLPDGVDEDGKPVYSNPGFPFFVPGMAGHRAPHPPMDFAWKESPDGSPMLHTAKTAGPFDKPGQPQFLNGGLPRHQVLGGKVVREFHSRWDFTKDTTAYDEEGNFIAGGMWAMELPEQGTVIEQAAMGAHATRSHDSFQPDGRPGSFILNGLPPVPGAPYAAPEVDDNGNSNFDARRYKAAVIQTDVVLNKEGWHYPQQRFITLLDDVKDTISGKRPPQPFFFRSNTGETIEFWHTNLVPDYYEMDDFQVRTPTDILGQHIHLVKFDVTSSDGAGNGFNYEDGTFSPDEVRTRIDAINAMGGLYHYNELAQRQDNRQSKLKVSSYKADYGDRLGEPPAGQDWNGAQTTVQRFDTDPLLNNEGEDRTLRTVFTHDHFGPSTHQQAGLYGALLVEPAGSEWKDAITGCAMPSDGAQGCPKPRDDGGPTSWQALIETRDPTESYREFAIATADLQLSYENSSTSQPRQVDSVWFQIAVKQPKQKKNRKKKPPTLQETLDQGTIPQAVTQAFSDQGAVLGQSAFLTTEEAGKVWVLHRSAADLDRFRLTASSTKSTKRILTLDVHTLTMEPGWADHDNAVLPAAADKGVKPQPAWPQPTVISDPGGGGNIGSWVANYRNEPLDARIQAGTVQAGPEATDAAYAYRSIARGNPAFNSQPKLGAPIDPNQPDGFRYPQEPLVPQGPQGVGPTDPYTPMLRAYAGDKVQVRTIVGAVDSVHSFGIQGVNWQAEPSFKNSGRRDVQGYGISEHFEMNFDLPPAGRELASVDYLYTPSSSSAGQAKGVWGIMRTYAEKTDDLAALPNNPPGQARDRGYADEQAKVRAFDVTVQLSADGKPNFIYKTCQPDRPDSCGETAQGQLILRAAAGEWVELTLHNPLSNAKVVMPFNASGGGGSSDPSLNYQASVEIGFTPRLLEYDGASQSGLNLGANPITGSIKPGESRSYRWYAGKTDAHGRRYPVEFGGVNLIPTDPLLQASYGVYGALIVEPEGSSWATGDNHSLSATITEADGSSFTEILVLGSTGGNAEAVAGSEVRLHVLNPNSGGGVGEPGDGTHLISLEGHNWREEPFTADSAVIGDNPLSQTLGTQQVTPLESYTLLLPSAGGENRLPGRYAYYYYPQGPAAALGHLQVTH